MQLLKTIHERINKMNSIHINQKTIDKEKSEAIRVADLKVVTEKASEEIQKEDENKVEEEKQDAEKELHRLQYENEQLKKKTDELQKDVEAAAKQLNP